MSLPDVTLAVSDGALGLALANSANIQAKIGVCSSGTANAVYSFGDIQALHDTLGEGPLVEAAALVLATGGGPVICVPATVASAGSSGSVSHSGTGTAAMTVSTATAYDSYSVKVVIVAAGTNLAALTATMKISLDGGLTYGPTVAVPVAGIYAIPASGLSITFADGTFVAADIYSFASTAPTFGATELTTAHAALVADPRTWFLLHVVGPASSASNSASIFGTLATLMATDATNYRFARAMIDGASDTDANFITAFASSASTRVGVGVGFENTVSPISGRQVSRSVAWAATARLSAIPPSHDGGAVADGPCPGITALARDERVVPGLDAARFTTMRTHIGLQGYYLTRTRLMPSAGSDFQFMQYGRVMDIACATARVSLLKFLNSSVRVNSNGTIVEKDARTIEQIAKAAIDNALTQPGDITSATVVVDRTANVLSTQTLPVTIRILPLGYASTISVSIGFANPALTLV